MAYESSKQDLLARYNDTKAKYDAAVKRLQNMSGHGHKQDSPEVAQAEAELSQMRSRQENYRKQLIEQYQHDPLG